MKKTNLIAILVFIILLVGCSNDNTVQTQSKNANTSTVSTKEYDTGLDYLGIVRAKDTKNYAFLSGGKLEAIYVEAGEKIKAGDLLAKLDTSSLEIGANTARINVNSLKNSLETAKSALDATKVLHDNGVIADKDWEAQENQYVTLEGNYEIAQNNLEQVEKQLIDSTIYADEDGYVMEVPYKAGEIIAAGYPVVIMKGSQKVISVGVSTDDIAKVTTTSVVKVDGTITANIDSIGQYPDEKTRAYTVDVVFESDKYEIGDMVEVQIITGKNSGCFVPVQSIFNIDGIDYVYVVNKEGIVSRKQIIRGELCNDTVQVDGIEKGTVIISDGVKNIKENDVVILSNSLNSINQSKNASN
ncbi:efflux RND transporter periplasmic adaptor subunit [Sinanaerobacter sp. ZZT-01]|uniref:efflux RND transporter periplasmic adaptor subunit n=1 Tax=Sinanaerobacter sp. ZZT-01 TaxID=3111540 RepID=UPI002D78AAF6|nr:efflux RND transporter periplasmic adaptor subunit [Sinanaerobacter sp. ZZT-01]WRR92936.1 efflux RND transporter periplasmic adaptor subunit [Sinanaerobacter sp. ZZT-01]